MFCVKKMFGFFPFIFILFLVFMSISLWEIRFQCKNNLDFSCKNYFISFVKLIRYEKNDIYQKYGFPWKFLLNSFGSVVKSIWNKNDTFLFPRNFERNAVLWFPSQFSFSFRNLYFYLACLEWEKCCLFSDDECNQPFDVNLR